MKLKRLWLAVVCLTLLAVQGCEEDVKNFNSSATSHLVAVAFISPQDTVLKVKLQRTQPAIGKRLSPQELRVENATVTLSDGNATVNLQYLFEHDVYQVPASDLAVRENRTYFLKVTTPQGEKAEAACTVPATEGVAIAAMDVVTRRHQEYGFPLLEHKLLYKWHDPSGTENYYRASAYQMYYARDAVSGEVIIDPATGQPYEVFSMPNAGDLRKEMIADTKSNGQEISSGENVFQLSYEHVKPPFHFKALLSVCDKNYYLYHKSIYDQQQSDGNPFAEPTLVYSNMTGGLGVFAAYSQVTASKVIE